MEQKTNGADTMSTILNNIPADAQITRIEYEGPRIALYTRNPAFLHKNSYVISDIVNTLKKRVVTRTEKSIRKPESDARKILEQLVPPEAGANGYFFDDALGEIIVEAAKPQAAVHRRQASTSATRWTRRAGR